MTSTANVINRRTLLAAIPASSVTLALPSVAQADPGLLDVIHELESWQGWEASSVVAAKAYAAYRMREALGMDLPDPKYARMHLEFQRCRFEDCRHTVWFERDLAEGKTMTAPRLASTMVGPSGG